jgi:hypothetical protein
MTLFRVDEHGLVEVTLRLSTSGDPDEDRSLWERHIAHAREQGESIPRWSERRYSFPLDRVDEVHAQCPIHGDWDVDAAQLRALIIEARANRSRQLNIKGTGDEPLPPKARRRPPHSVPDGH